MTRGVVAKALGVSIAAVRRLEGKKLLHPVQGKDGYWHFDSVEVEMARRRVARTQKLTSGREAAVPEGGAIEGQRAALLFPFFERGATLAEVIEKTQVAPAVARELFWEWRQGYARTDTSSPPSEDEVPDDAIPSAEEDEKAFAAWEAEVEALDREQARIDRLARRAAARRRRRF
jgi:hypothetical protein